VNDRDVLEHIAQFISHVHIAITVPTTQTMIPITSLVPKHEPEEGADDSRGPGGGPDLTVMKGISKIRF
jgi:hypothetical protein